MLDPSAPIIFLDIDGVLATKRTNMEYGIFDQECAGHLNRIIDATGASIVVTSTWRTGRTYRGEKLVALFREQGVTGQVVGRTPDLSIPVPGMHFGLVRSEPRWKEIIASGFWNEGRPYIIIDDEESFGPLQGHLIQTVSELGLTAADAERAIEKLKLEIDWGLWDRQIEVDALDPDSAINRLATQARLDHGLSTL